MRDYLHLLHLLQRRFEELRMKSGAGFGRLILVQDIDSDEMDREYRSILALPPKVALHPCCSHCSFAGALTLPEPFPGGWGISSSYISCGISHRGSGRAADPSAFVNPSIVLGIVDAGGRISERDNPSQYLHR